LIVITRHGNRTQHLLHLNWLLKILMLQLLQLARGLRLVMKMMRKVVLRHLRRLEGGGDRVGGCGHDSRLLLLHGQRLCHSRGSQSRIDRGQQQGGRQQMLLGGGVVGGLRREVGRTRRSVLLLTMMERWRRMMV
jgi:hypothetical protein